MKKIAIALTVFAIGATAVFAATMSFSDVSSNDWFYDGVMYSSEHDLMTGYGDGTFGPNDPVNRAQLATVLERMDAEKIDEMYMELTRLRDYKVRQLRGGSWEDYLDAFAQFHVLGIQLSGEGGTPYEMVEGDLDTVAIDNSNNIQLLTTEPITPEFHQFFIRVETMGGGTFGPFADDVNRLIEEIEAKNAA